MSHQEKTENSAASWDERHASGKYSLEAPHGLLISLVQHQTPGKALDLACGAGRHAVYLAENGWRVTAVDNSAVGIRLAEQRAKQKNVSIDFRLANLEESEFTIAENEYDLICDFYYLQRDLFVAMKKGVRQGGVIVAAVHIYGEGEDKGRFMLREGELQAFFGDFEILHYHETSSMNKDVSDGRRRAAEIVCRKTGAKRE